ncbi:MAG: glycosyltransferase family 1 protein, partial [Magnetococcales bacterium]|nr:glycosyltransferase family 1 protein [Magnetococcales bacterium]
LANKRYYSEIIAIGLCLGGLTFNNPMEYMRGANILSERILELNNLSDQTHYRDFNQSDAMKHLSLYCFLIIPATVYLLDLKTADKNQVLELFNLMRSIVPYAWIFFDGESVVPTVSMEDLEQPEILKSRLLKTKNLANKIINISYEELASLLQSNDSKEDLMLVLLILLTQNTFDSSYLCGMTLAYKGYQHPLIAFVISVGNLLSDTLANQEHWNNDLRRQINLMPEAKQKIFYNTIVCPILTMQIARISFENNEKEFIFNKKSRELLLNLHEVIKSASPLYSKFFDWESSVPPVTMEAIRYQGYAKSRLIRNLLPPLDKPRAKRRVVVALPKTTLPRVWLELANMGPRLTSAFNQYGWQTELVGLQWDNLPEQANRLVEKCLSMDAELLILDVTMPQELQKKMIAQLKMHKPSIKVAILFYDEWAMQFSQIREYATVFDILWSMAAPDLPIWKEPQISKKVFKSFIPIGVNVGGINHPLKPQMLFSGNYTNWPRLYLLLITENRLPTPIIKKICTHHGDGLPALVSYEHYMQGLMDATCCISLALRKDDLSCVITGRIPDILRSGSLLVQETTSSHLDNFMISGEHYLEFSSLSELEAIAHFIANSPSEAEEIRRRGFAFYCEHYNDDKLVGYLDYFCFHS